MRERLGVSSGLKTWLLAARPKTLWAGIAPVIMGAVCVNCHNVHPESQKRDWKVGDVRGIQEIAISQAILVGFTFIAVQRR